MRTPQFGGEPEGRPSNTGIQPAFTVSVDVLTQAPPDHPVAPASATTQEHLTQGGAQEEGNTTTLEHSTKDEAREEHGTKAMSAGEPDPSAAGMPDIIASSTVESEETAEIENRRSRGRRTGVVKAELERVQEQIRAIAEKTQSDTGIDAHEIIQTAIPSLSKSYHNPHNTFLAKYRLENPKVPFDHEAAEKEYAKFQEEYPDDWREMLATFHEFELHEKGQTTPSQRKKKFRDIFKKVKATVRFPCLASIECCIC